MNSLKTIISDYHSGLLKTPNIQMINKKLSDEIIEFPGGQMADLTFSWSSFRKSNLVNMEFIHVNFESSYFEECLIKNSVFKNGIMREGEVENCEFIDCKLSDWDVEKTIFNNCKFLRSSLNKSVFNSCDFWSPIFEDVHTGLIAKLLRGSKQSSTT